MPCLLVVDRAGIIPPPLAPPREADGLSGFAEESLGRGKFLTCKKNVL
jgi:hypothetical protein